MTISTSAQAQTVEKLVKQWGEAQRDRIETGVRQVALRWRKEDGDEQAFQSFCLKHFTADSGELEAIFQRFQKNLESLYGNLHRIYRDFNWMLHVDAGPILPIDYLFGSYDAFAHVSEDMFKTGLAFVALLNIPLHSLEEKNQDGLHWSRRKWAELRLVEKFADRVPAAVNQQRTRAYTLADDYISNYNIYMDHVLDPQGQRLFPEGLKLISHWGLRDELKARYADQEGLARQEVIFQIMKRIISQEIPAIVVNNPKVDWNPFTNEVFDSRSGRKIAAEPEGVRRYRFWWQVFQAERAADAYYPDAPSLIDRRFKRDREIPEASVEALIVSILSAPVLKDIADLIRRRLGRELRPFDIWYTGFKPRSHFPEEKLDALVQQRYPNLEAFQKDLPNILQQLGFPQEKARFLAEHIQVDPARGAGHAMGARMRSDKAHLRTRVPAGGMNYKGFNIAIHELGHNVEQVFSLNGIDYYTLEGVPNTAFTEAFAFVFQSRDLALLGLEDGDSRQELLQAVHTLWSAFEIAGVSLVDMKAWRWLYAHPEAGPEAFRQAVLDIAREVWNTYFAPVLGSRDETLLAVYSHMVDAGMYIPDYTLGQVISFQIERYLKHHSLGEEMEGMCRLGRLAPQVWMQQALGEPIQADGMIQEAEQAVQQLKSMKSNR